MTLWLAVLVASVGCYLIKLAGQAAPAKVLENDRMRQVSALLPAGLLAALVVTQAVADGDRVVLDARLVGVAIAVAGVWLRLPFLLVVALAAAGAAGARLLGMP